MSECDEKFEAYCEDACISGLVRGSLRDAYRAAWSESRKSCEQWMAWNGHELADVIVDLQKEVNTLTKLVPKAPERMMMDDLLYYRSITKELREENQELQKEVDALKERVSNALCEFSETQKSHKRRSCRMAMALSDGAKEGWSWMWEGEEDENQQLQTQLAEVQSRLSAYEREGQRVSEELGDWDSWSREDIIDSLRRKVSELAETQGKLAIAVEALEAIQSDSLMDDVCSYARVANCEDYSTSALKEINQDPKTKDKGDI